MAEIRFQILGNNNGSPTLDTISGSGLAFFGSSGAGSSVAISEFQDTTFVANGDASIIKDACKNVKWTDFADLFSNAFPSGKAIANGEGTAYEVGVTGIRSMYGTLGIEFGHTSAVNVQNCQLKIYDRNNTSHPATGVNTRVAELVNWNGSTFDNQGTQDGICSTAQGSGDLWWWGEPWPSELIDGTQNFYTNSVGTTFYNGRDNDSVTNGDARLAAAAVPGSYDTVGGTGIVVPLLDSPGSGQKQLGGTEVVSGTGMVWPKWTQYCTLTADQNEIFGTNVCTFGDGSDTVKVGGVAPIDRTFGGTGVDTHHTWSVAVSASPLSTGSKEQYGLYVSLEYL